MSEQKGNSATKVASGIRESVNPDGSVLLDIKQGLCFSLNPIGAKVWRMLQGGYSLDEITDDFEKEFSLPRAQLLGDVSDFLGQLEKKRLIGERFSPTGGSAFSRLFRRSRSA